MQRDMVPGRLPANPALLILDEIYERELRLPY